MRVNPPPPDMINTLPPGPWLSQTSARGQRSGLAFLYPNPPWVPTCPLSRRSPSPVTHTAQTCSFFLCLCSGFIITKLLALLLSLNCLFHFLSLYYFFHLSLVSLFIFANINSGQQLSWDACKGSTPPFSCSLCLTLLLWPSIHPSLSCSLLWHCKDQFTQQQPRQASCVPGLPSEQAFFASRELLAARSDIERLIALLPNLTVLCFSSSLRCWTHCTLGLQGYAFL